MIKNLYNVNRKDWKKWSDIAKKTFNKVFDFAIEHPNILLHAKQEKPKARHWKVLAWNFAWIAADAVDDALPTEEELKDHK